MEHALSPAIVSPDSQGVLYAKIERMHFPKTIGEDYSVVLNEAVVYSKNALWNAVEAWFNGTAPASDGLDDSGILETPFINNGGSIVGEIFDSWPECEGESLLHQARQDEEVLFGTQVQNE